MQAGSDGYGKEARRNDAKRPTPLRSADDNGDAMIRHGQAVGPQHLRREPAARERRW